MATVTAHIIVRRALSEPAAQSHAGAAPRRRGDRSLSRVGAGHAGVVPRRKRCRDNEHVTAAERLVTVVDMRDDQADAHGSGVRD
jgi:hypothetical protein